MKPFTRSARQRRDVAEFRPAGWPARAPAIGAGAVLRLVGGGPIYVGARSTQPLGLRGVYRVVRLWRPPKCRRRIYADVMSVGDRRWYTIYVSGPRFRSPDNPSIVMRPYRFRQVAAAGAGP
jgi:hypothetical protein